MIRVSLPKPRQGKPRKFCDKSCARKYTCRTKPEVVKEANKKGFQTLLKNNPERVSTRSQGMTEKRWEMVERYKENGHFKKMNAAGGPRICGQTKRKETMIEKGLFLDPEVFDHKEFKRYQQAAHRMTKKLYGRAGKGYHWDHIVPVETAFEMGISIAQLSAKENIRKISAFENLSKGSNLTPEAKALLEKWGTAA